MFSRMSGVYRNLMLFLYPYVEHFSFLKDPKDEATWYTVEIGEKASN